MAAQVITLGELLPQVAAEAIKQGIDPVMAQSILIAENTKDGVYDPMRKVASNTLSPKGATGVMQVMPQTLQGLIKQGFAEANTDLTTVTGGIHAGVAAIKELVQRLGTTDPKLVAAGYNGSPTVVQAYASGDPSFSQKFAETAQYIQKVDSARAALGGSTAATAQDPTDPWSKGGMRQSISQYTDAANATIKALQSAVGVSEEQGEKLGKAHSEKAEGEAQKATAQEMAGTQQLTVMDRLRRSVGLVPEDPNSVYSRQIATMDAAQAEVDALSPQVAAAQNADMLTNPLGWILGQAKMVTLGPRLENAMARVNIAKNAIDTRENIAARQASLEAQTTQEALHLQKLGATAISAADAQIAQLGAQQQTLALRTRIMTEQLGIQGNLFQMDATMFRLMQEKLGQKKLDDANKEEQETLDRINTGLNLYGIPSIRNLTEYKQLANNPQTREVLSRLGMSGTAGSPGKTMVAVEQLGALPNIKQQDPVRGAFMQDYRDAVAAELARGRPDPKTPGLFTEYKGNDLDRTEAAADNVANRWIAEAKGSKDFRQLSKNNPYRMNSKAYASSPELRDNLFAQFAKSEREAPDEEKLLAYATGKILANPAQASVIIRQFNEFMTKGRQQQMTSYGMYTSGWDTKIESYPLPQKTTIGESLFGDTTWKKNFNLMNEADVKWYLQKQAIEQLQSQARISQANPMDVMGNTGGFEP